MAPPDDTLDLRQRLESLPQELYDEIYDLTFTAEQGKRVVTKTWRPPVQLHISRDTRLHFSKIYFANDITFRVEDEAVLGKWLKVFGLQVLTLVEKIELCCNFKPVGFMKCLAGVIKAGIITRAASSVHPSSDALLLRRAKALSEKLVLVEREG